MTRVEAETEFENKASQRVLENIGKKDSISIGPGFIAAGGHQAQAAYGFDLALIFMDGIKIKKLVENTDIAAMWKTAVQQPAL